MKQQQKVWVNRIQNLYNMGLGVISGMSVMHLIFLFASNDKALFLKTYQPFANLIVCISQILTNFVLIFGMALVFIYK